MKFFFLGLWIVFAGVFISTAQPTSLSTNRPAVWAVKIEKPGVPNFHRLSENLFRGAQPSQEGMAELKKMGIKTIIDLRAFHSDDKKLSGTKLESERLHAKPWHAEDEDVIRFLKIATDTNNFPVFVHCQQGADRTGTMCAMYRMAVCGWTKDEALREMTEGGFGFHSVWKNLVTYVKNVDVDRIKRDVGIKAAEPQKR